MHNLQNCDTCITVPSSQTYISCSSLGPPDIQTNVVMELSVGRDRILRSPFLVISRHPVLAPYLHALLSLYFQLPSDC
jgi:hypothetical protein